MYIVFFGKSQDFTSHFYDRNGHINDFNSIIRDFSLLESKIFTIDRIDNKEILARYFFTAQGKNYCLIKLYSFAQALDGARIDGSIYGVGLLSDQAIDFSQQNMNLLKAAKENFAKLSLDRGKFNKSDFKSDSDRIWSAVSNGSNGNLLDKVSTFELVVKDSDGDIAIFVNDLFRDPINLTTDISFQNRVYFSEDLEHLKRTLQKWGKDLFSIYWEQNGDYVPYKELSKTDVPFRQERDSSPWFEGRDSNDLFKLRSSLSEMEFTNQRLEEELKKIKKSQNRSNYFVYGLSGLVFLLLVLLFFFEVIFPKEVSTPPSQESSDNTIDQILVDSPSREEVEGFVENIAFIYSFDDLDTEVDTTMLNEKYQEIIVFSSQFNFDIKKVREKFLEQKEKIKANVSGKNQKTNKNSETRNEGN